MSLQPVFEQYKGDIVAYYKHYPLPFHKNAMLLAKIYEAGKKLGYHFDMYGKDINGKNYEQIMKLFDVGVKPEDMGKFYTELNNPAITDKITRNVEEAKQVGVQGTPFLLVNGHPVSGNRPELIKELIETEMSK
jgi:protein-disulfide isomerase